MTREEEKKFVEECRSWLGMKWIHGQCLKGYGVDCIQFIAAISKFMGWLDEKYEIPPYPRDWALHCAESKIEQEMGKYCRPVELSELKVGDILLYKFGRCNSHAAWYLGTGRAIHSHIKRGVEEFDINEPEMSKHFTRAMRWKGRG